MEISLDIGGFPIVLCDTAGLRHSTDPVENEGLKRAKEAASTADLVIIVMDASRGTDKLWEQPVEELVRAECQRLNLLYSKCNELSFCFNTLNFIYITFCCARYRKQLPRFVKQARPHNFD